jgi:hypothetical protein
LAWLGLNYILGFTRWWCTNLLTVSITYSVIRSQRKPLTCLFSTPIVCSNFYYSISFTASCNINIQVQKSNTRKIIS